jgi:hypothetical protein
MNPPAFHAAIGFLAAFWPPLFIVFHVYQVGAFILRREKIMNAWLYDTAATWHHLWPKLVSFAAGFGVGLIVRSIEH